MKSAAASGGLENQSSARVWYDDEDDDRWYREYDPRAAHVDALLAELRARMRAAAPFNPLKVASTESPELVSWAEPERELSHCVRLYDLACWRGHTAIFSVMQGERRCVTVEISVATRGVVQAKRACNQTPSAIERAVIEHWRTTIVAGLT